MLMFAQWLVQFDAAAVVVVNGDLTAAVVADSHAVGVLGLKVPGDTVGLCVFLSFLLLLAPSDQCEVAPTWT